MPVPGNSVKRELYVHPLVGSHSQEFDGRGNAHADGEVDQKAIYRPFYDLGCSTFSQRSTQIGSYHDPGVAQ